jgi:integrase
MAFRVENYRSIDQTDCVSLFYNESGLPFSFWLSCHLKNSYSTYSTRLAHANFAKFYFDYFIEQQIDIEDRIESLVLLTKTEHDDFIRACLFRVDKEKENLSNVFNLNSFSEKELDNLIHATTHSKSKVSAGHARNRINSFRKFIEYVYKERHAANRVPSDLKERYNDYLVMLKSDTKEIKDDNAIVKDAFEQAIPTDVYFRILEISKSGDDENPWSQSNRLRNHIITQIFNETGIRVGALCKLKISDLRTDVQTRLVITRTPNDPTDSRRRPAAQKTQSHVSAISAELMQNIQLYIDTVRAKYPISDNHDFIFVSQKGETAGEPLAKQSVNELLEPLSKAVDFHIHPHLLRHKWNEIFEDKAKAAGYSPERINDLRKYACGWSDNSKMVGVYNEFKNAQAVAEISMSEQGKIVPKIEKLDTKKDKK